METLVVGNVAYWSEQQLHKAFGDSHVVLAGEEISEHKKVKNITWYQGTVLDGRFQDIFLNYGFDRVIFISDYLTFHGRRGAELEELRHILQLCRQVQTEQILCLVSSEICSDTMNGKIAALQGIENLCSYYAKENWLSIKIVRAPFLASGEVAYDYFARLFQQMEQGHVTIEENAGYRA